MKIVLIISKLAGFFLRLLGRGSTMPGAIAYKLNKNITKSFKLPKTVIAVTGSAGKGSTSKVIVSTLESTNKKVVYNKSGSNMLPGIISLLLENCDLKGNIKADALVVEVDERYTKSVFEMIKPQYVVVTNICRDQPPRHGHVDLVLDKIKEAITPDIHLILNADDPILRKLNSDDKIKTTYYGINENKLSYKKNKFNSLNIYYCPKCNSKLEYNYYHIESLGDYYCSKCKFKRPKISYLANEIDLDKGYMIINGKRVTIGFNILYYAYNLLAAYSVCATLGIDEDLISNHISQEQSNNKLDNVYKYKGKNVYVLSSKNEDNFTFNQSMLFVSNKKCDRTIIIGWKEISRRYEFNDMSWLYDIEFELLNDKYTKKIICAGRDRYDIATRMKYAGFKDKQIKIYEDLKMAEKEIKSSNTDLFAVVNFDYVNPFNELMKGEE